MENSLIHKTNDSLNCLENVFNGLFDFCSPYSPDLKPIEKGFKLVKEYLRTREDYSVLNLIDEIIDVFQLYSITGEFGDKR